MKDENEKGGVPEGPRIPADTWFALAIASMIISAAIGAMIAVWVFNAGTTPEMVQRAQSFTPFGGALLAIVTFFTVAWRGVLNTRQLEHQAAQLELQNRQLGHQARQIDLQTDQFDLQTKQLELQTRQVEQQIRANDASDQANLARLLQEGARLLGEKEKEPQILGGIVTLETLVIENGRFSAPAMDLLLNFIERSYDNELLSGAVLSARTVMARGAKNDVHSSLVATFRAKKEGTIWSSIKGASKIDYYGGVIRNKMIKDTDGNRTYDRVRFEFCSVFKTALYWKCTFENCVFSGVTLNVLHECTFRNCDFSDVEFGESFPRMEFLGGNTFIKGRPPRKTDAPWQGVLTEMDEAPAWTDSYHLQQEGELAHI